MKRTSIAILLTLLVLCIGCNKKEETATTTGGGSINIVWAEWEPATYLQELAADFTKETGIEVNVKKIPWGQFQAEVYKTLGAKSDTYDIVIGDSQWLGWGVSGGHYVDLSDWLKSNGEIDAFEPSVVEAYAEYPKGSGKLYSMPTQGDAIGFAYRKDLFENPSEMTAFKAKYGRDLAVPDTWQEFRDVAEFFTRPDKGLYGCALYYGKEYDGVTMGFQQVLWSFGGELYDPETFAVQGVINSPEAVQALEFYVSLAKFNPKGYANYYWQECLQAYQSGSVAMAMDYFAFFPGLTNEASNKFAKSTGFFMMPGYKNADGTVTRYISLGGQGMSLCAYSKKQDLCKQFMEWFAKRETQEKWAQLGGFTCRTDVLESDAFKSATSFNAVFAASMPHLRDFWAIPEYEKLLESCQRNWNAAAVNQISPKAALDKIAQEHTDILKKAGILKQE